jgi:hypothetical protein
VFPTPQFLRSFSSHTLGINAKFQEEYETNGDSQVNGYTDNGSENLNTEDAEQPALVTTIPPADPNVSQNNHAPWESPLNLEEQKKQFCFVIIFFRATVWCSNILLFFSMTCSSSMQAPPVDSVIFAAI